MATRKRASLIEATLRDGISNGIVLHLQVAAERAGEEIAQEWLKDPAFKAEMRAIAQEIAADLRRR
jgi:hypothetical protein